MALDQINPFAPVAPVKFDSPLEQYNSFLQAQHLKSEIDKAQRAEDDSNATNKAYKDALTSYQTDHPGAAIDQTDIRGRTRNNLIMGNRGQLTPAFDKANADTDQANAKANLDNASATKADVDAMHATLENLNTQLKSVDRSDPQAGQLQMFQIFKQSLKDPVVQRYNKQTGISDDQYMQMRLGGMMPNQTPDQWNSYVDQMQMTAKEHADAIKPSIHVLDLGDKVKTVAVNANGTAVTPLETDAKKMRDGIHVNVNTGDKSPFAKTVQEGFGKDFVTQANSAVGAKGSIDQIDNILDTIAQGHTLTGPMATPELQFQRYLKAAGFNADDKTITDTQAVNKALASNVFAKVAEMKQAGVPLVRLTNQELALVEKGAPSGEMDEHTIVTLLNAQRKMIQNSVEMYRARKAQVSAGGALGPDSRGILPEVDTIPDRIEPGATKGTLSTKTHKDVAKEFGF